MSTIAAGTTSGTALVSTGDTTGTLVFQTNGTTTALTLGTNQSATFVGAVTAPSFSGTSSTATNLAGGSNGTIPYQSAAGTTQMLAVGSSGQYLKTNGVGAPSWATVSAGYTLGTPVATTSGTSIDFTGIPAGTKQIVINFASVSVGASPYLIQIGDSGGVETTGYASRAVGLRASDYPTFAFSSAGYINRVNFEGGNAVFASGSITLTLENATAFTWIATGTLFDDVDFGGNGCSINAGKKSLSAELDRVRITTVSGSNTFDNGEINIAYI